MIIVMGVPGAGKTSVLKGVMERKQEYKIVNYGDLMLGVFGEKYGVKDRDEMRKTSVAQQKAVQKTVAERLSKMDGKVILDTHCSIRTPKGYLPGLPFALLKKLKVDGLVLVSATVDEICGRRKKDKTRIREANKGEIAEHLEINFGYLAAYSAFTGAPATIIMSRDGKLPESVERFVSILE